MYAAMHQGLPCDRNVVSGLAMCADGIEDGGKGAYTEYGLLPGPGWWDAAAAGWCECTAAAAAAAWWWWWWPCMAPRCSWLC
jgi:hypothetical protein